MLNIRSGRGMLATLPDKDARLKSNSELDSDLNERTSCLLVMVMSGIVLLDFDEFGRGDVIVAGRSTRFDVTSLAMYSAT